ncbi:MAG: tetratricopeptide repeat protein [Vicinamibacterales bacterium]
MPAHDAHAGGGRLIVRRRLWRGRGLTAVLCLGLLAAFGGTARAQTVPERTLFVAPFEHGGTDASTSWLGEGAAVVLTEDLNALGVRAIARDVRVRALEQLGVPAASPLSHATVIRVGRVVGADVAVVGSIDVTGETLVVRARTIALDSGASQSDIVESGPLAELFEICERVARRLAPGEPGADVDRTRPTPAAFEQYIRGVLAGVPAEQIGHLTQALRLSPDYLRVRLALWDVYSDQGEHLRALDAVRLVPDGRPQTRLARFLGGVSMVRLDRLDDAFETLTALQTDAPDASVLNNLGVIQLLRGGTGNGAEADAYFSDAIALEPSDGDLYFNAGYAHWRARDATGAIEFLREALRRNPADAGAHFTLGVALASLGNGVESEREKALARQLSADYAEWDAAAQGVNTLPPDLARLKFGLSAGRAPRVEDVIGAVAQQEQRELVAFHLARGQRLLEADRDGEALAELRRVVFLAPYHHEAHLLMGRLHLRAGRTDEAMQALKISLWSQDTVEGHLALAEAYVRARSVLAARSELQLVLARDPGNVRARDMLAGLPPL